MKKPIQPIRPQKPEKLYNKLTRERTLSINNLFNNLNKYPNLQQIIDLVPAGTNLSEVTLEVDAGYDEVFVSLNYIESIDLDAEYKRYTTESNDYKNQMKDYKKAILSYKKELDNYNIFKTQQLIIKKQLKDSNNK
jgi:hypothetical protein